MAKRFRLIIILIAVISISHNGYSQIGSTGKEFNQLYKPVSVIMRLSYDNFKKIKLLRVSILNYGGGKAEFDKLVDDYAEASALYFQNKILQSANLFTRNGQDINEAAMKLAKIYKEETEKLHVEIIKMSVKYNIKQSLKSESPIHSATNIVRSASFGLNKANDLFIRSRPIDAIYHYRKTKKSCLLLYKVLEAPLPDKYKRDMADNQNEVYESKEKEM